jgi:RNA exonuclease 1
LDNRFSQEDVLHGIQDAGLANVMVGSKRSATDAGFHPTPSRPTSSLLKSQPDPTNMAAERRREDSSLERVENGRPDEEWSVAESKSSRKKRRKLLQDGGDDDNGPSVRFLSSRPAKVQLKALQDLVLYVLGDGVAPTWLAVNHARQIQKVVVLMIPGLDGGMLEDEELTSSEGRREEADTDEKSNGDSSHSKSDATPLCLDPRLLKHVLEVKAPGDSSTNRVHSPLQGMLIAPLPEAEKKKNAGRNEKSVRTPVAHFVHSADDLRDAEYPIHPAALTDPADARLEMERREQTGQSVAAGWVNTDVEVSTPTTSTLTRSSDPLTHGLKPYALDCEMVLTADDQSSLARISVVDWHGQTVMDRYVKPALPVKNYFTQYSGITPAHLENVTTTLQEIQRELLALLGADSILLGHSLESDLHALKLTHPFVVDTSIIYPHPRGLPLRSSLKFLANRHLRREIQNEGPRGHDSVEDARAVLDLVRLKCEKGPQWGTLDAHGESIFRRIARMNRNTPDRVSANPPQTAIVEYGTPERGFGRDATYKISCATDDEIVQGVLRAVNGDPPEGGVEGETPVTDSANTSASKIPPDGVDFVWGRFRDLEAVQGWNMLPPEAPEAPSGAQGASVSDKDGTDRNNVGTTSNPESASPSSADPASTVRQVASRTLARLQTLFTSLPARTLLVVYSGTSDMRPVLRLQQLHAQYRKEFKIKKWDELTVRWTDDEAQQLRKAVEAARTGVGLIAVS